METQTPTSLFHKHARPARQLRHTVNSDSSFEVRQNCCSLPSHQSRGDPRARMSETIRSNSADHRTEDDTADDRSQHSTEHRLAMMIMLPRGQRGLPRGQCGAASTPGPGTDCNCSICISSTQASYPAGVSVQRVPWDVPWHVPWRVPWHVPWRVPWHVPWRVPWHVPWHQQ